MPNTKPSRTTQVPASGLTRSQVAHHLGVGVTAIHRLRIIGELHPQRDDAGVWRYDPADVIRAAAKRGVRGPRTEGETAALAFEMFELGAGLRELVMALHLPSRYAPFTRTTRPRCTTGRRVLVPARAGSIDSPV